MDDDQQFCLRWNNHQSTLVSVFDTLLEKGIHVDCTLAAEGQTLKAHKVVLSACSPYFENVLSQQFDKHPIIILKDVKYAELRAMMDYMYRGEVNISQDQLAALLKAAESLQIKGLSDNKPSRPPSRPAQPAPAHPPRTSSPPPQVRDSSIDSREGSVSPTRRRKKARRMSSEVPIVPMPVSLPPPNDNAQGNGDEKCKEEIPRDGVEDLTLDEEAEEQPAVTHNDVVRNFQWHMERSQDELMNNSNDGVRESQGPIPSIWPTIVTRSKKVFEEPPKVATLAVLKNVTSSNRVPEDTKENKTEPKVKEEVTSAGERAPPAVEEVKSKARAAGGGGGGGGGGPRRPQPAKIHSCPKCARSYNARKNLLRHMTLECGREPQYKCPHCSYSKHRRNELKSHLQKKHPNLHAPQ